MASSFKNMHVFSSMFKLKQPNNMYVHCTENTLKRMHTNTFTIVFYVNIHIEVHDREP